VDFILGETRADASDTDHDAKRYHEAVARLVRGFKLASGSAKATEHAEEVAFFTAVRASLDKIGINGGRATSADADFAIEQLINRAVASTEVVDILQACGFDRPDISVLSDEFLADIRNMQHQNLAVEAFKKLLNGEISTRTRSNIVQKEVFSQRLEDAIARYHNRSVDAVQVIQELIELAKKLREEPDDQLSAEERAFYDALAQNGSAAEVMGNDELRVIAAELVATVRNNAGVDWWRRDNVRAKMRSAVKRILAKHGYPPDLQKAAIQTVIKQAEALAETIRR